jgi:hypothetical protein
MRAGRREREGDGMTTSNPISSPPSTAERLEADAALAGIAAAETLRGIEAAVVVLLGLLVCPPLAILVVVVVVPLLVIGLVVALLAAVVTVPYLLFHHIRNPHGGHGSLLAHRLRAAGRAVFDLAPHRIAADVRKLHHSGR